MRYYFTFIAVMSLLTYCTYSYDKHCAIKHQERVPERTLLLLAFLGGAPGALLAMYVKHHKTRKWLFKIAIPLFIVGHVALFIYYFGHHC